ncbi:MAG: hypothetical protein QM793_15060 [Muricomes sp.]
MKKRFLTFVLVVIMAISFTGCSENESASEDDAQKYYWQSFYEKADYEKYKTPASENGLDGTLISVEGTITQIYHVEDDENKLVGIIINDENKHNWISLMNVENNDIPDEGDKITAYMVYLGISSNHNNYPSGALMRYVSWIGDNDWLGINNIMIDKNVYAYLAYEDKPPYIDNWDVETEDNIDYYNIYLESDVNWPDMDEDKQISLAKETIRYFKDSSFTSFHKANIMTIDSNGNSAFSLTIKMMQ